jgi:hypothetical protein
LDELEEQRTVKYDAADAGVSRRVWDFKPVAWRLLQDDCIQKVQQQQDRCCCELLKNPEYQKGKHASLTLAALGLGIEDQDSSQQN